ncbi:MAG: BLUF domain-containing protein [Roseobacter sp.]
MEIHYVLYVSKLVRPFGYEELNSLLYTSQRNNAQNGLAGFLQIEAGIVLQYLEGAPETLLATIQRIRADPRHGDFLVLASDSIAGRFFDGWQMALVESTTLSLFDLLGIEVTDVSQVTQVNPTDLISLLSANASFLRDRASVA